MTTLKKQTLRNNEYYGMQEIFDNLYYNSKQGHKFKNLMKIITDEKNIMLAYRNIKGNKGSKTAGVNGTTINDISKMEKKDMIEYIQNRLMNLQPHVVRRVMIPKGDGTKRPLGIPSIEDRIVQQAILQVLEPILEPKFHKHSYGFRQNRNTSHALARVSSLINNAKFYYAVDIDIKGFFDNVNHGKLLKQLWTLGVQDKSLLKVLSKILKAKIEGEGTKHKGTPQGGILSPILSNVVLNELDWWISSQWETFQTTKDYTRVRDNRIDHSHKYRALKTTKMKPMFIVRYADDFKIMTNNRQNAEKIMLAVKDWLKMRLNLEVNEDKSKIVNLKKNTSDFLGFKIATVKRRNKYVAITYMSDKAKQKVTDTIISKIKTIQKNNSRYNVAMLNAYIFGVHGYYNKATRVSKDFADIGYRTDNVIRNRLGNKVSRKYIKSNVYEKYYKGFKGRRITMSGISIYPVSHVRMNKVKGFQQEITDYTVEGRKKLHTSLDTVNKDILNHLSTSYDTNNTVEYNNNKSAVYSAQQGKCKITKELLCLGNMELHHILPIKLGGTDEYKNLVYVTTDIHKLIHAKTVINTYTTLNKLNDKQIKLLNKYRNSVGNDDI